MTDQAGQFNESFAVEATPGKNGVAPLRPVAAVWKGAKTDSVSAAGASPASQAVALMPTTAGKLVKSTEEWLRGISIEEVKKHDNEKSCWFVVKGNVYDGTPYLQDHPGGASSIFLAGGPQWLRFEAVHSTRAWEMLVAILRDPEDKTMVRLLFANQTPDDILARDVLEELAAKHPDCFTLSFTLTRSLPKKRRM